MSILDRMRAAVSGTLDEIREARKTATEELITFRAGDKLLAARAETLAAEIAGWQGRAEQAVLAGDDDLATQALRRRDEGAAQLQRLRADREEQARYAADLLRGRRELDAKLKSFELRQGQIATGLAAVEQAEVDRQVWERFADAEARIEEESIAGELAHEEIDAAELARQQLGDTRNEQRADAALEELKRKMREGD